MTAGIEAGAVLLHRKEPGRLIEVQYVVGETAYVTRIDDWGVRVSRARRRMPMALSRLAAEFQVYRPCRWSLDCLVQASVTVAHSSGDIDACSAHAADQMAWTAGDQRGWEPEPECWCPDGDKGRRFEQPYCPAHGTPLERGTNLGELLRARAGAAPAG